VGGTERGGARRARRWKGGGEGSQVGNLCSAACGKVVARNLEIAEAERAGRVGGGGRAPRWGKKQENVFPGKRNDGTAGRRAPGRRGGAGHAEAEAERKAVERRTRNAERERQGGGGGARERWMEKWRDGVYP